VFDNGAAADGDNDDADAADFFADGWCFTGVNNANAWRG
jgi:hypothetical protein